MKISRKRLPRPISKEEFDLLFEAAKQQREHLRKKRSKKLSPTGRRINQYMIAMILGFHCGLRISEIVGWKDNVPKLTKRNIENNLIRVISGKGGKDRMVPKPKLLNQSAIGELPLTVSRRSIQLYIERLSEEVLKKHVSFHMLRHGFITYCLESGIPISQIQIWAGHSRLDTTGRYLHILKPEENIKKYEEAFS